MVVHLVAAFVAVRADRKDVVSDQDRPSDAIIFGSNRSLSNVNGKCSNNGKCNNSNNNITILVRITIINIIRHRRWMRVCVVISGLSRG